VRGQFKDGEVRGFSVAYDQALEGSLDHVVIAMASAAQAFPAGVAAAPPPRRKVEYGTAVVISGDGYALTTRDLVEGCQVITLTGYGPADRVAADGDSGLALLRVYGVGNLKPAAIAAATAPTEATLVGIADPERQGGGHAPSVAAARFTKSDVADRPAIVPVPGLGFAGAPAVDRQGHVLGLADVTTRVVAGPPVASAPHATLIPGSAIKAFLAQHKVAAGATASSSVEGVKGSVARVICWRK
ncbi:MAG: trypsin-like peptidase domain-containing protein, partial [Variibacter sp.]|nr:trypsin-like peptidase domain-containing protein [Variibacter sp.]